jgi:hypothetical protein
MECGSGSPDEIATCLAVFRTWIDWVKPIVGLILAVSGLGTAAAVVALFWLLQRHRAETRRHEEEEMVLREAAKRAIDNEQVANEREAVARADLRAALAALERLRSLDDEQQWALEQQVAELRNKLEALRGSLGEDDAQFWARPVDADVLAHHQSLITQSIPVLMFANQEGGSGQDHPCHQSCCLLRFDRRAGACRRSRLPGVRNGVVIR